MKQISFIYDNNNSHSYTVKGLCAQQNVGKGLCYGSESWFGEYYGIVEDGFDSYLIAKTTNFYGNMIGELTDKFIVRPVVPSIFGDGSGNILLDQRQSKTGQIIEDYLNNFNIKDTIHDENDIISVLKEKGIKKNSNKLFGLLTVGNHLITISISHDVFEIKNNIAKACRHSLSTLDEIILNPNLIKSYINDVDLGKHPYTKS